MRGLGTLIWKEWRDARMLILGAVVLSLLVSLGIHAWVFDFAEGQIVARFGVPLIFGLFVAALASDLVAGDVASSRIATWALLPTSTSRLWEAKTAFLVIASLGFAAWTVISQWLVLALFAPTFVQRDFTRVLPESLPYLAAAVCCGAAVLFFSTLLERGFAAVLSGLAVLGAGYALVRSINLAFYGIHLNGMHVAVALIVAGIVFFLAARMAFLRGPIHSGSKARLGALAFGVLAVVLIPLGSGTAYAVHSWFAVKPGSSSNLVRRMAASPDGRYLAVQWTNRRGFVGRNWNSVGDYAARVWVIDLETGKRVEVPARSTELLYEPTPWTAEGQLQVWTRKSSAVRQDGQIVRDSPLSKRIIDPATGETLKEERVYRVPAAPSGPGPFGRRVSWAKVEQRGAAGVEGRQRWVLDWQDGRAMQVFDGVKPPIPTRVEGVVLHWGAGRELVRHDLKTHTKTILLKNKMERAPPVYGSPDGKRLITWVEEGTIVLDATTGKRLAGPWKAFAQWDGNSAGSRFVSFTTNDETDRGTCTVVDLETGRETPIGKVYDGYGSGASLARPADDKLITAVGAGPIVLRDLDGNVLRTLYEGPGE